MSGSEKKGGKKKPVLRVLKGLAVLIGAVIVCAAGLIGYLSATEYYPEVGEHEALEVAAPAAGSVEETSSVTAKEDIKEPLRIVSWNIGYGALGDNADFFMDGGKGVKTADRARVQENMNGIIGELQALEPDAILLQELDRDSMRSSHIDETALLKEAFPQMVSSFANNFRVAFIPYPIPPIGKVDSGLFTLSSLPVTQAERIQLPCPFSWPLRTINLKRCLQVMRAPVSGSSKELVLINLHLEAYDEGEGKIAQTNMLKEIMLNEINKGNYVIAAGDFNQTFSNTDVSMYPCLEGMWESGIIDTGDFGSELDFYSDNTVPTCRSLDRVLIDAADKDPQHFQYYMLDGYIVSSNVEVKEVKTLDLGFKNSDHNPVVMRFELKAE